MTVTELALVLVPALPIVLGLAVLVPALERVVVVLAPAAALPAIAVALASPSATIASVGLGTRLGAADPVTRAFVVAAGLLWGASALFATSYMAGTRRRRSFWSFFLVTMGGNLGAVVAQDLATFYTLFTVMTFASYGLVAHDRTPSAARAGRVYMIMSIGGEVSLLSGMMFVAAAHGDVNPTFAEVGAIVSASPHRDLVAALLSIGLAVKAGVVPLHVWLPLAHPVAPSPASAVLSGAIIKTGLLGWLRLLPLGIVALPVHGGVLLVAGFVSIAYAAIVGATQADPKTVLAYSSVSQMGFATAAVGAALWRPEAASAATAAVVVFAVHHAFAKGVLFLGEAAWRSGVRRIAAGCMLLAGLAIAGAPATSGALAKVLLKEAFVPFPSALGTLLSIGAVGSTVLVLRFATLLAPAGAPTRGRTTLLWMPLLSIAGAGVAVVVLAMPADIVTWSAAWPVLAGAAGARLAARRLPLDRAIVPAGDALVLAEGIGRRVGSWRVREPAEAPRPFVRPRGRRRVELERIEGRLARFTAVGTALLVVAAIVVWTFTR